MSCKDCDDLQEGNVTSYFRWGTANIEVRACRKHLKEVYDVLREAQKQEIKPKPCPTCDGFRVVRGILGTEVPCPNCSSVGDLDT